jgi:hypothetical protein
MPRNAHLIRVDLIDPVLAEKGWTDDLVGEERTPDCVDVLVSWNFKHIVNLRRIHLYNAVNLKEGYGMIDIRTPQEVLDEEDL